MKQQQQDTRGRWGRARFGGGTAALLITSLAIGTITSAALGALFTVLRDGDQPGLVFVVFAACILPVTTTAGWAALVDRSTLAGAIDKPADSVESTWYNQATSGAFHDILMVTGLGALAFTVTQLDVPAQWLLLSMTVFAMLDVPARYLWLKRAAG